ncbi:MAG: type II toxin-antitoxin system RelE/ParE family toxin [Planctomycetes bacterium]|nr:type II toxin-antitoxin system RelE/ParE family toxin [Planctomycetota bacterium]
MARPKSPKLRVLFFRLTSGEEPVRRWLKEDLSLEERKRIGRDIMTIQFRWPLGMPLVRSLGEGLHEVRSRLKSGIARVFFSIEVDTMVLLHGFVKKTQKTPIGDLEIARKRLQALRRNSP